MGTHATTTIMGLIAAVAAAAAFWFYPKPVETVVDTQINQDLFESYNTSDVRVISITKYDEETNRIEQFRLQRKGDNWILPQSGDFPATGIARIGEVAKSLLERKVLAIASDEEQAHFELGVVDPTEAGGSPNRASLGMKIELKDRDRTDIASLIIGNPVSKTTQDGKYFVRISGQPTVYEMEIPKRVFSTRFEDWMDTNLLSLPRPGTGTQVASIDIENYKLDPKSIAEGDRQNDWNASFSGSSIDLSQWKDDKFKPVEMNPEIQNALATKIGTINQIRVVGATGKPKSAVKPLRDPSQMEDPAAISELASFGIRASKGEKGLDFESANGTVSATTSDGVTVRLLVGSLATQTDSRSLGLNYHAMVMAELDASSFAVPEKPEDVEEDSDENKAWLRAVDAIEKKKTSAKLRVDGLNRSHAKWIYIVPESVVSSLIPELTLP